MYTTDPPEALDQGVIVADVYFYAIDERRPALILTPTCDFEQRKAELIQVCAVFDAWDLVAVLLRTDWIGLGLSNAEGERIPGPLSAGKRKELSERIRQVMTQKFPRYHGLAPIVAGAGVPLVADFQVLNALPRGELDGSEILARLDSPYREQASARYGAYMGRVGTPDIAQNTLDGWTVAGCEHLFPEPRNR